MECLSQDVQLKLIAICKLNNMEKYNQFYDVCIKQDIKENDKYFYKLCPFGEMRLWKKSKRITVINLK